nr:MAG TPA: hypothetical protein [Caudoviricetes sp.]DAU80055.1 MAG TPA: hypothetical protein [Caudoviricetes sp.]DAX97220.1 MAG TPA: hypothetical protein [Caudoviricetes sp.]
MVNNGRARKRVLAPTIVLPRLSTRHRQFTPLAFQVLRIQHQSLRTDSSRNFYRAFSVSRLFANGSSSSVKRADGFMHLIHTIVSHRLAPISDYCHLKSV